MKIKKLYLSDEVVLAVAEDIAKSYTIPKYEQFLTKHGLLSYNPNDYSYFNKVDFIRSTLGEIDKRLFLELDNKNILSDETKDALIQEEVVFENLDSQKDVIAPTQIAKTIPAKSSPSNVPTTSKEPKVVSLANQQKTSLAHHAAIYVLILFALIFAWIVFGKLFPESNIVPLIILSIFIYIAIVTSSLKRDGIISDDAFVNVFGKIAEMIKAFTKR